MITEMAEVLDTIKTLVEIPGEHLQRSIPAGTEGVVVDKYSYPEGHAVDIALPSDEFVGGHVYDNVILYPGHFVVVESAADRPTPHAEE